MKRSEINALIAAARSFARERQFLLPRFATWTPGEWHDKGSEVAEIVSSELGWDITDFGSGDFKNIGLVLFNIRNGTFAELEKPRGKIYAEKMLIIQEGQITPTHFHHQKMEDIINRAGGDLIVQLWNSKSDDALADTPVTVSIDGVRHTMAAGGTVTLEPGDSICLTQRLYHKFWAARGKGPVLAGEVSRVNNDHVDNRFYEPVGRFPEIEEDIAPLHLLITDYPKYYRHANNSRTI
jgi:D-lyxose ketol-isomerase